MRLGAGSFGKAFSGRWLQAQHLAHATAGGVAAADLRSGKLGSGHPIAAPGDGRTSAAELADASPDSYLRELWDQWWRERDRFAELLLPGKLWRFSGLRPANQPQRRLAWPLIWLAADDLPARLEAWFHHGQIGRAAGGFAPGMPAAARGPILVFALELALGAPAQNRSRSWEPRA